MSADVLVLERLALRGLGGLAGLHEERGVADALLELDDRGVVEVVERLADLRLAGLRVLLEVIDD